jgi:tRNA(Arg) A34 adenosine deaminase TadA
MSSKGLLPACITVAAAAVGLFSLQKIYKNKKCCNHDLHHTVEVNLPDWAKEELHSHANKIYKTDEEMMQLAIHLSARNVEEETGGPFGSAIFERNLKSNEAKLISVGVDRVVVLSNSTLHGETVAIQLAQSHLQSFTMRGLKCPLENERRFELFTSCEPCAMCLGATFWSGVSRIVCAATKDDAEAIGFDEGPVFKESYEKLEENGIQVTRLVLQKEAAAVLQDYGRRGVIYNSTHGSEAE